MRSSLYPILFARRTTVVPVTWSPTDHSSFITISNGNLTATRNNTTGGAFNSARSNTSQATGTRYVEFVIGQVGGGVFVGVGNGSASLSSFAGAANSAGYASGANLWIGGGFASGPDPPSYTTGDVIGMLVDLDGDTVKYRKNGGTYTQTVDISSLGADIFVMCSLSDNATFSVVTLQNP